MYAVIHTLLCGAILISEEKKVSVNSDVIVMICTDLCLFVQVTITMTLFTVTVVSNSNGYIKCR